MDGPWRVLANGLNPLEWRGQRQVLEVPKADIHVYLHQIRPLRPGRSLTFVHDLIPLQIGSRARRIGAWTFLKATLALSNVVLTDSAGSRDDLIATFHFPAERIVVVNYPTDGPRADRIIRIRRSLGQDLRVLYVGRFGLHKNLERLCLAWQMTDAIAEGGELSLIGGTPKEVRRLRHFIKSNGLRSIKVAGPHSEAELDIAMATSRALVLPSIVEGYGLPAFEAAATGLPVAVARTGAMTSMPESVAVQLDPYDLKSISHAVDTAFHRESHHGFRISTGQLYRPFLDALALAALPVFHSAAQ
jgi:glycosyltransferase involved in cell wall biosynthesis